MIPILSVGSSALLEWLQSRTATVVARGGVCGSGNRPWQFGREPAGDDPGKGDQARTEAVRLGLQRAGKR